MKQITNYSCLFDARIMIHRVETRVDSRLVEHQLASGSTNRTPDRSDKGNDDIDDRTCILERVVSGYLPCNSMMCR